MENPAKTLILNILDYLRYQVVNDKCTPEELRSFSDAATQHLDVDATIGDIAKFYGKSNTDVSNVISRRLSKPKRRVYYNFAWFAKVVPKSWHKSE